MTDTLQSAIVLREAADALPLDHVQCPDLRRIAKVWLDLPRDTGEVLPRWSSFHPGMLTSVLDKVCILHVGDWRQDEVKFSLYGGHATDRIGNGRRLVLETMKDDPLRRVNYVDIRDRAGRAVDHAAPQYAQKSLVWDGLADVKYEVLMLPFKSENGFSRVMQPLTSEARPH